MTKRSFDALCLNADATADDNMHSLLKNACRHGELNIVKELTERLLQSPLGLDLNAIIRYPASIGQYDIVEYLISMGVNDFNDAFADAFNHIDILRLFNNAYYHNKNNVKPITQDTLVRTISQVSTTTHAQTLIWLFSILHKPLTKEQLTGFVERCKSNFNNYEDQHVYRLLVSYRGLAN